MKNTASLAAMIAADTGSAAATDGARLTEPETGAIEQWLTAKGLRLQGEVISVVGGLP